jgi:hypothetical protein
MRIRWYHLTWSGPLLFFRLELENLVFRNVPLETPSNLIMIKEHQPICKRITIKIFPKPEYKSSSNEKNSEIQATRSVVVYIHSHCHIATRSTSLRTRGISCSIEGTFIQLTDNLGPRVRVLSSPPRLILSLH